MYYMYQMYLEDFCLSLTIVMLIKYHLLNREKGEVEHFFTFFITSTGKSAIIFSDWNLNKHLEIAYVNV